MAETARDVIARELADTYREYVSPAIEDDWLSDADAILAALIAAGQRVVPEADLKALVAFVEAEECWGSDPCFQMRQARAAVEPVLARWREQG